MADHQVEQPKGHDGGTMIHRPEVRVAVNGFGRIGRLVTRIAHSHPHLRIVAVNDIADVEYLAYAFRHDSVHGRFPDTVQVQGRTIIIGDNPIKIVSALPLLQLPWRDLGIDCVIESSGLYRAGRDHTQHLEAGARRVIVTAPTNEPSDPLVVYGVNHNALTPRDLVVSMASCSTASIAPPLMVLHKAIGLRRCLVTGIHAYSADQRLLDMAHVDLRRSRAAAVNIIPTSTGSGSAMGRVIPELAGKVAGVAIRVPVPDGSLSDMTVELEREVSAAEVVALLGTASEGHLKGVLRVEHEQLVSSDLVGDSHSSIIDAASTSVLGGTLLKLLAWYDNEWGYAARVVDLAEYLFSGNVRHDRFGAEQTPPPSR